MHKLWNQFTDELNKLKIEDRRISMWWRDDDATEPDPHLAKCIEIAFQFKIPLSLSVIPALTSRNLAILLGSFNNITVLQHGYAHRNWAPVGAKKREFGLDRPIEEMIKELQTGWSMLLNLFGNKFLPILVPPWNRISNKFLSFLNLYGFEGISTSGPRQSEVILGRLLQYNATIDIIDWENIKFIGEIKALKQVLQIIRRARKNSNEFCEPICWLTHHKFATTSSWNFLERLFEITGNSSSIHWMTPNEVFQLKTQII